MSMTESEPRPSAGARALRPLGSRLANSENRWIRMLHAEWSDPVARGGVFLLVNTAVTGVFGLLYWMIAARLYPQAAVGRAGALVSASTLLAGVGQLNLSGMLMRFLPEARERSRQLVLVTYGIACASSLLLTVLAGLGVAVITSRNSPLRLSAIDGVIFAASVAATVVFTLQDSVLIALRRTGWVPVENGGFGFVKILLLIALAGFSGWGAIFASWMLPLAATLPLITWLLFGWLLPRTKHHLSLDPIRYETKRRIRRFVIGDASAGVFTQTWTYLLPVIVTAALGAKQNALFYGAFLFSSTLDQIAVNYSSPLVVEGARTPDMVPALVVASLRRVYVFLIVPVVVFVVFAPTVLRIYGAGYVGGAQTLRILALACLPKALLYIYYGLCRVQRQTHRSAAMQGLSCVAILAGALIVDRHGLLSVAAVVLAVQTFVAALAVPRLLRAIRAPAPSSSQS